MKYSAFIFLFIVITCFISCKKPQVPPTQAATAVIPWRDSSSRHPKNAALKALIDKYNRKGLPGISLLVSDASGTWVGSTGKADLERNIPFNVDQVSKVASITKLFIGALVFKLIEDSANTGLGYRSLDTKINNWLPSSITGKLANGTRITLGQCMKHETGVPDVIEEDAFYLAVLNDPNKMWKPEELLAFIYNKPAVFNPGDTAIYSNTNTILTIMVIEAATHKKHSDLLKQYILDPLQLLHTWYQPHDALPNTVAQGYFDLYNNNTVVNVSNFVTGSGNGYGGIYSNIFDLFTFIRSLLISKTLLSPKSLSIMQTYGKPDDPNQYGYGIMKKFISRGVNAGYGHSGRDLGYTANVFYFPNKGVTHAFLVNYGTDSKSNLRQVFYDFQEELLNLTLQ
jgi:D-alanyl-D-alanine carboxypeptidase